MTVGLEEHPRRSLTADEVLEMVEAGILGEHEPVELLDGELVVMSPQEAPHRTLTIVLRRKLEGVYGGRAHIQDHSSFRAGRHSLPEPDVAVVRGAPEAFWRALAQGPDIILIVEIAYKKRAPDRRKAAIYAKAGVPVYWVVDNRRRTVTVYEHPTAEGYRTTRTLGEDQPIAVPESDVTWRVADVLPPA